MTRERESVQGTLMTEDVVTTGVEGEIAIVARFSFGYGDPGRREWDSNPRSSSLGCFQDRCLQPLGHLYKAKLYFTARARVNTDSA